MGLLRRSPRPPRNDNNCMFGKKPEIKKPELELNVQTMPVDFYGGVNPVIKFKKVEKIVVLSPRQPTLTAVEKKILDKSTAAGSGLALHPASLLTNKKYVIIFGVGLFVAIAAGASVYYYFQLKSKSVQPSPKPPVISMITTTPVVIAPIPATTSIPIATTTPAAPSIPAAVALEFPSSLLGESADLDKDNITDVAEEIFSTDPSKPDTDEDSYNDGHEVFYLYNPAGVEPMKLIASGMVKEYKNFVQGYSVYYPNNWAVGVVDEESRDVLFSTITGENIEIRAFDMALNETFADWFSRLAPNEKYGELQDFASRFFSSGKTRGDGLVYYFVDKNRVYAMVYHTTDSNTVNYKSVMLMMARSFSLAI